MEVIATQYFLSNSEAGNIGTIVKLQGRGDSNNMAIPFKLWGERDSNNSCSSFNYGTGKITMIAMSFKLWDGEIVTSTALGQGRDTNLVLIPLHLLKFVASDIK